MNTLDSADDFDLAHDARTPHKIARFARSHEVTAHVTRTGAVLLTDRDGGIKLVRTMRAACEWLGY